MRSSRRSLPARAAIASLVAACASPPSPAGKHAAEMTGPPSLHALVLRPVTADASDLAFLAPYVAGKRIVGLGEVTHGTAEVFTLKTRVVQYLVTAQHARMVAIEMNYGATFALADYVAGRASGDPARLLADIGIKTYQTRELATLIGWLHAYNQARPASDRVEVVGFDLQDPRADVRVVLDYLRATLPSVAAAVDPELATFASERGTVQSIAPARVPGLRARLASLTSLVDRNAEALRAGSSAATYRRVRYALEVARTAFALFDEPSEAAAVFRRDREDATHLLALAAGGGPGPVALWAHNTHVARANFEADGWTPIGDLVGQRLGDRYYAIGTAFFSGSVRAKYRGELTAVDVGAPRPGSLEYFLRDEGGGAAYFVDLHAAAAVPAWAHAIRTRSTMRAIGSVYAPEDGEGIDRPTVLGRMFDALIFIPTSTAAEPAPTP